MSQSRRSYQVWCLWLHTPLCPLFVARYTLTNVYENFLNMSILSNCSESVGGSSDFHWIEWFFGVLFRRNAKERVVTQGMNSPPTPFYYSESLFYPPWILGLGGIGVFEFLQSEVWLEKSTLGGGGRKRKFCSPEKGILNFFSVRKWKAEKGLTFST